MNHNMNLYIYIPFIQLHSVGITIYVLYFIILSGSKIRSRGREKVIVYTKTYDIFCSRSWTIKSNII